MIRKISSGKKLVALHVDWRDIDEGTHPLTDTPWPLQALMIRRQKGHVFAKHTHARINRASEYLQEAIIVMSGELLVTLCERNGKEIESIKIMQGQVLFLVDGGYKVEVMKDAVFYEFKNGPHFDDKLVL